MTAPQPLRPPRGAGGTPGGLGTFFLGAAMAAVGAYLLADRVTVTSGFWRLGGYDTFGFTLLVMMIGIGFLFFNGRSAVGWVLTSLSLIAIVVGIVTHLRFFFQPTSLFGTVVILALLAGGIGLVARSLRAQ